MGKPWMLYRGMLSKFPLYQRHHSTEISLADALGVQQRVFEIDGVVSAVYPTFSDGRELSMWSFFAMCQEIIAEALLSFGYKTEGYQTRLTVIPFPGVPMSSSGDALPYFSHRSNSVCASRTPSWVVPASESKDAYGRPSGLPSVNLCMISRTAKPLHGAPSTFAVRPQRGSKPETLLMVAHSSDEELLSDQAESGIESCGGMLYPSLSVGTIPASVFGPICLIFDPRLVLKDLAPFRASDSPDAPPDTLVYKMDAWTPVMSEFVGSYASRAFFELSGNDDFSHPQRPQNALYSLGPFRMASDESGLHEEYPITTTTELCDVVNQRSEVWRDQTFESFKKSMSTIADGDRDLYLEAKAISVLPVSWVTAVAAPAHVANRVAGYLSKFGFRGVAVSMDLDEREERAFYAESGDADPRFEEWVRLRYGWRVSRAIRETGMGIEF